MLACVILMIILPFLSGAGWMRLRKEKERISPGQCYLMGLVTIFLMVQISSMVCIKTGQGLDTYTKLMLSLSALSALISGFIGRKELMAACSGDNNGLKAFYRTLFGDRKQDGTRTLALARMEVRELLRIRIEVVIIVMALIFRWLSYMIYVPDTGSSVMAETVSVTAATRSIFTYNALTGQPATAGIYPIYKLASLPIFYSALYSMSGLSLTTFLYILIPAWVFMAGLAVILLWAEVLSRGMKERKVLFLMYYSLLILMRSGIEGTYGRAVTYEAFKGRGLAASVLMPMFLCGIYLIFVQKERLYGGAVSLMSLQAFLLCVKPVFSIEELGLESRAGTEWVMLVLSVLAIFLLWDRSRIRWKTTDVVFLFTVMVLSVIPGTVTSYLGLSYTLTRLCDLAREWGRKKIIYISFIALICLYGTVLPLRSTLTGRWEVPAEDTELQELIRGLREEMGRDATVLAPDAVMERCRLYGDETILLYGKDLWRQGCYEELADVRPPEYILLHNKMTEEEPDTDAIAGEAAEYGTRILVLPADMSPEAEEKWGYVKRASLPGYQVYCRYDG